MGLFHFLGQDQILFKYYTVPFRKHNQQLLPVPFYYIIKLAFFCNENTDNFNNFL